MRLSLPDGGSCRRRWPWWPPGLWARLCCVLAASFSSADSLSTNSHFSLCPASVAKSGSPPVPLARLPHLPCLALQDANKESGKASKPHKVAREHRERPRKDSESRSCSKEPEREPKSAKDAARKLPKEEKAPAPKAAFKEPKMALKEAKLESLSPKGASQPPTLPKASSKRPAATDSPKPSAKKPKKSGSKGARRAPGTSPRASSSSFSDKKVARDKSSSKGDKGKAESESREAKRTQQPEDSHSEDEASFRSEVSRWCWGPFPGCCLPCPRGGH